ncbi:hypothetical protein ACFX13_032975 [Malus domestica]
MSPTSSVSPHPLLVPQDPRPRRLQHWRGNRHVRQQAPRQIRYHLTQPLRHLELLRHQQLQRGSNLGVGLDSKTLGVGFGDFGGWIW